MSVNIEVREGNNPGVVGRVNIYHSGERLGILSESWVENETRLLNKREINPLLLAVLHNIMDLHQERVVSRHVR